MKILILQKRILFPPDTGGKIRTLNVVRHLASWHDVTYLCNVQEGDDEYKQEMTALGVQLETIPWHEVPRWGFGFYRDLALNVFSPYPFTVSKDYDAALRRRAEELIAKNDFDLVICDFVQMARNAIGLPARAKLLFEHNVEAQIFGRHAKTDEGWLRRKYMALQWHKMRRFEADAGRQFDLVVAVSNQDRKIFEEEYGWQHVRVIDTAVDAEFFKPNGELEQPNRLVFVGSMDWLPNQDAIKSFAAETWPRIRSSNPAAHLQVVGRNPTPDIVELNKVDGIEVVGTVPDVRPYLNSAAAVVVPLRIGGGTRIKIVEAMAMKKAIVSTTIGAEGLPVQSGRHIMLADSPVDFAKVVVDLLGNADQRHRLADEAIRLVHERFLAESVARQFESYCLIAADIAK